MSRRRPASAVRAVLGALLLVPALFLITPTAAMACSCAAVDTEELLGYADTVALGELTGVEPPPARADGNFSSDDRVTYTVALDAVFQGDPADPLTFQSASHGASCGLEDMQVGTDYVFFVRDGESGLCDGTSRATTGLVAEVEALTGPGQAVSAPAAEPAAQVESDSESVSNVWPALAVGAMVLVAAGWLIRRRWSRPL